jgi:hypothetical protein
MHERNCSSRFRTAISRPVIGECSGNPRFRTAISRPAMREGSCTLALRTAILRAAVRERSCSAGPPNRDLTPSYTRRQAQLPNRDLTPNYAGMQLQPWILNSEFKDQCQAVVRATLAHFGFAAYSTFKQMTIPKPHICCDRAPSYARTQRQPPIPNCDLTPCCARRQLQPRISNRDPTPCYRRAQLQRRSPNSDLTPKYERTQLQSELRSHALLCAKAAALRSHISASRHIPRLNK